MSTVLTISKLTKRYGRITAVNELDLQIEAGQVYGILGPNGSGKTTTLGMLLGVVRPTSGDFSWYGQPASAEARRKVGAILEMPAFLPYLNAVQNLRIVCQIKKLPFAEIDRCLALVNLTERSSDPFKTYSLGMKQRLAIASALLCDPGVLILDEPTNGLDPAGIVEVRTLLMELGAQGRTLLVSSHLLSEIEAACSWVVIIRFGEMLFSGPLADLMARTGSHVVVVSEHEQDLAPLAELYTRHGYGVRRSNGELVVDASAASAPELNRIAAQHGITLKKLAAHEETLEETFLQMTGANDGDHTRFRSRQRRKRGGLLRGRAPSPAEEAADV